METIRYAIDADDIATVTFDAPGAPVNTMTIRVAARSRRRSPRSWCATKQRIKGVLLASAKKTFFAGAALKHVLTLTAADAAPGFAEIEAVQGELSQDRDVR